MKTYLLSLTANPLFGITITVFVYLISGWINRACRSPFIHPLLVSGALLIILLNVLNIPLELPQTEEGPGYGAAMLAMVGCGEYDSAADCAAALVRTTETIEPDPELSARYEEQYQKFRKIYPSVKNLFKEIK